MDDDFVDLALTPQEKEERSPAIGPQSPNEPIYPFGASISLENDQIEKLGLEDGEVGDYIKFEAYAKLSGLNVIDTEKGKRKCMNIQITHMKIESDDDEDNFEQLASHEMYGS